MKDIKDYINESLFSNNDERSIASGLENTLVKEFIEKHLVLSDDTYTEEQFQEKYGYELHGDVLKLFTKNAPVYEIKFYNIPDWKQTFPFKLDISTVLKSKLERIDFGGCGGDFVGMFDDNTIRTARSYKDLFKKKYFGVRLFNSDNIESLEGLTIFKNMRNLYIQNCYIKKLSTDDCDDIHDIDIISSRIYDLEKAVADHFKMVNGAIFHSVRQVTTLYSSVNFDSVTFPKSVQGMNITSAGKIYFQRCIINNLSGATVVSKAEESEMNCVIITFSNFKTFEGSNISCRELRLGHLHKLENFKGIPQCDEYSISNCNNIKSFEGFPEKTDLLEFVGCDVDLSKLDWSQLPNTNKFSWVSSSGFKQDQKVLNDFREAMSKKCKYLEKKNIR